MTHSAFGVLLEQMAERAQSRVWLIAPFIKRRALEQILANVGRQVDLRVWTRWVPQEVANGVSDIEVYDLVIDAGGVLHLYPPLHAKAYFFDSELFVGSANLTDRALGWRSPSNLEILVPYSTSSPEIDELLKVLDEQSVEANPAIQRAVSAAADQLQSHAEIYLEGDRPSAPPATNTGAVEGLNVVWIPRSRDPGALWTFYSEDTPGTLSTSQDASAQRDMEFLRVPGGLTKEEFAAYVGSQILQCPAFALLSKWTESETRFGEVRRRIERSLGQDRTTAGGTLQILLRWMLLFCPDSIRVRQGNHTEFIKSY